MPIKLPIVPLGTKLADSLPMRSAATASNRLVVGSSPKTSSPSSAAAMAARIASDGMATVSDLRSITLNMLPLPAAPARDRSVDQSGGGGRWRVVRVEVDADGSRAGNTCGVADDLAGQRRAVATVDRPVCSRRVDGPDVLRGRTPIQGVGAGVARRRIDDDPVVLLAGVDVGRSLGVLGQARPGREVELHGAWGHVGGGAWRVRVTRVGRDYAEVF